MYDLVEDNRAIRARYASELHDDLRGSSRLGFSYTSMVSCASLHLHVSVTLENVVSNKQAETNVRGHVCVE